MPCRLTLRPAQVLGVDGAFDLQAGALLAKLALFLWLVAGVFRFFSLSGLTRSMVPGFNFGFLPVGVEE